MPELPEVHTTSLLIQSSCQGKKITKCTTSAKKLREIIPEHLVATLPGKTLEKIQRIGKYIAIYLAPGEEMILAHLGMSGSFNLKTQNIHDHFILEFYDGTILAYNDPRRFGLIKHFPNKQKLDQYLEKKVGIDPILDKNFSPEKLQEKITLGKKKNAKSFLMDQSNITGIGNIYASEIMFYSKVNPLVTMEKITVQHAKDLHKYIIEILSNAIKAGGSTISTYQVNGESGKFQNNFAVYGKEGKPCKICNEPILKIIQQSRSTYYCPNCQR